MQVTVIIPTYKRIEYLKQALNSVINQSYQNFNCLIANDCPEDSNKIKAVLSEIADERFILIDHQYSQGGNAARNSALKQASGDIIAFLDDDDMWLPNKLLMHINKHQVNPNAGLIYSGIIQYWDNDELPSRNLLATAPPEDIIYSMSTGGFCPYTTSCVTVRKICFDKCGLFDETLESFQDWDMWYRIAQKYDFDYISEPLIVFRQHLGERTSISIERRIKGLEQIANKWKQTLPNAKQFKLMFLKLAYISFINQLILQDQKRKAFKYLYELLKHSNKLIDIIVILKVLTRFFLDLKSYKFMLNLYIKYKINF
jgi:glycosyltransferase involved in cell wall biosynthesis